MVKNAGRLYLEESEDSELRDVVEDLSYVRREEPPDQATLLERFQTWVRNTPGSFEEVLKSWVRGRLEMKLAVNPGLQDPNERPKKSPTKKFREALEAAFNQVRQSQAEELKKKKKAKRKPRR